MRAKSKSAAKRLFIADDHPMMRSGLAQLIDNEPDMRVCGEAGTAAQALDAVLGQKVDLLLLDISLPDRNGLELLKDLRTLKPELPVLVISMHDEAIYAERVLRAGGRGYLMKQEGGKKLLEAVRRVLAGEIYLSEKMSGRILESFAGRARHSMVTPVQQLSDREFEVFQMIGRSKGTREIAQHLRLSIKTVEVHRTNIKKKLELKSSTDLVSYAARWAEGEQSS